MTARRLSEAEEIKFARIWRETGLRAKEVGAMFGLTATEARNLAKRHGWTHNKRVTAACPSVVEERLFSASLQRDQRVNRMDNPRAMVKTNFPGPIGGYRMMT